MRRERSRPNTETADLTQAARRMTPRLHAAVRKLIGEYRSALARADVPIDAVLAGYRNGQDGVEVHVLTVLEGGEDRPPAAIEAALERVHEVESRFAANARARRLPIRFLTFVRDTTNSLEPARLLSLGPGSAPTETQP